MLDQMPASVPLLNDLRALFRQETLPSPSRARRESAAGHEVRQETVTERPDSAIDHGR